MDKKRESRKDFSFSTFPLYAAVELGFTTASADLFLILTIPVIPSATDKVMPNNRMYATTILLYSAGFSGLYKINMLFPVFISELNGSE